MNSVPHNSSPLLEIEVKFPLCKMKVAFWKSNKLYLGSSVRFIANWVESAEFPHTCPSPGTHTAAVRLSPSRSLRGHSLVAQSPQFTLRFTLSVARFMGFDRHMARNHHCRIIQRSLTAPQASCALPVSPDPPRAPGTASVVSPFPDCHVVGILRCAAL